MSAFRMSVVIGLAVFVSGCANDWKAETICRAELKFVVDQHDPTNPNKNFSILLRGIEAVGGQDAFVRGCADASREAVQACSEHKYGSDSGIDCVARRVAPAINAYVGGTVMQAGARANSEP